MTNEPSFGGEGEWFLMTDGQSSGRERVKALLARYSRQQCPKDKSWTRRAKREEEEKKEDETPVLLIAYTNETKWA